MANFQSRRLEALLGCAPHEATWVNIQSLLDAEAVEDYDLDFKSELYGNSDSNKRDLAGDVAALANTAGGLIVIGVREDDQARATAVAPVPLSDDETRRMTQIIATLSPLPTVDIHAIPGAVAGEGYYLLAVPRSPLAPHAMPINNGLRYPVRNISTTRYLSEPEVAAAYRQRSLGAAGRSSRSDRVMTDGVSRLDRSALPWVCVALVPEIPGDYAVNGSSLEVIRAQYIGRRPKFGAAAFMNIGVARGRLQLGGGQHLLGDKYVAADLHTDGSGFLAEQMGDISRPFVPRSATQNQVVNDEDIVCTILSAIQLLASFARDQAHAGGTSEVRATLLPTTDVGLEIGQMRSYGIGRSMSTAALRGDALEAAQAGASLDDLAAPSTAGLQLARELGNQCAQAFGIAELKQISDDGAVRVPYWTGGRQSKVVQWADAVGLPIVES